MKRSLLFASAALFAFGCTGPAGMMGPQGSTGMTGSQGAPGMTGSQGSTGMTGSQGAPGMTGSQGSQGSAGVTGAQGPAGVAGVRGPTMVGTNWAALKDFTFDYDRTDIRSSEQRPGLRDRGLCAAESVRASRNRRLHRPSSWNQPVQYGAEPPPYRHGA